MIRPARAFIMEEMTACVSRKLPVRLVWRTSLKSAAFMRRARPSRVTPALLTRMSTRPRSARTALAPALMESSTERSRTNGLAWPPAAVISAATASSLSSERAARAMVAPCAARASAQARPIPWDAPVTSATLPCMDIKRSSPEPRKTEIKTSHTELNTCRWQKTYAKTTQALRRLR